MGQTFETKTPVKTETTEPQIGNSGSYGEQDNRGVWMGEVLGLGRMRGRDEQPRGHFIQFGGGDNNRDKSKRGERTGEEPGALTKHGSIARLDMPNGFVRTTETDPKHQINRSLHSPDSYRVFKSKDDPDTKISYWKLDAYAPRKEAVANLEKLLTAGPGNPAHKLTQDEIDAISEALPNALYGYNDNFDVRQLRTTDINGKRVLMMETKYRDADRNTIGIFANPDLKTTSIELAWFEAPKAGYKAHADEAWKALANIKWEGQPAAPQPAPAPARGLGIFRRR